MSFNSLLNTKCDIQYKIETQNTTTGQKVISYANRNVNVKCRLDEETGNEQWIQNEKIYKGSHILFLVTGLTILKTDRVKIGTTYYDILNIADAGGQGHHTELVLQVIQ